eukprot:2912539-Pyramimonas_sp.AAC.1
MLEFLRSEKQARAMLSVSGICGGGAPARVVRHPPGGHGGHFRSRPRHGAASGGAPRAGGGPAVRGPDHCASNLLTVLPPLRSLEKKGTSRTGAVDRARGPSYWAAGRTGLLRPILESLDGD